jgi:uncharacterized protein DUF3237
VELEHAFDYRVLLGPPVPVGAGRMFYEALGGELTGQSVSGEVLRGGGDWALVGSDGFARLDVRGQVRTHDGAFLYITYPGLIELNEPMQRALATGGETGFDDQYFRITPRVETGDERYRWMTKSAFVGRGRAIAGPGVAYEVYRVV